MDFKPQPGFERAYAHSPGTLNAVQEVVMDVHDFFQSNAARDTGAMVRSAHPTVHRGPNGWEASYNVPVENEQGTQYGKFVEFGTRHMRAQHTLRNALQALQEANA